ncbi:MAG: hypothetical protein WD360_02200 [Nitriliruptoraceae bacterium]
MRKRDLAVGVTLAGLAIGALRQGSEARAVRMGKRAGVVADTPATTTVPALFGVPHRPGNGLARTAAALWSAPLTAVGFVLAFSGGAQPRYDHTRGAWVAVNVGGVSALLQRRVRADAHTMGQVVLCQTSQPSPALLDHESAHVRQAERFGVLMPFIYGLLTARHGYMHNPFEASARNYAWTQKNR